MENRHIIINDTIVSYLTTGKGEQSLIFLHGWRSHKEAWLTIAEKMETSGYRLFFIDLPGFGVSEAPKKPYTLHDYAETIRIFAEKLGLQTHAVIGHSAGARVATCLLAEQPNFATKLVLIASGGMRAHYIGFKKIIAKILKPFFMPRCMAPLRKRLYQIIGAEDYYATPELQKTFINIIHENQDLLFKKITTDTLVVWGDKDTMTPLTYGMHIQKQIPHSHIEVIRNAGHYCFSEQPEQFTATLIHFLKQ